MGRMHADACAADFIIYLSVHAFDYSSQSFNTDKQASTGSSVYEWQSPHTGDASQNLSKGNVTGGQFLAFTQHWIATCVWFTLNCMIGGPVVGLWPRRLNTLLYIIFLLWPD